MPVSQSSFPHTSISTEAFFRLRKRWFWMALPFVALALALLQANNGGRERLHHLWADGPEFKAILVVAAAAPLSLASVVIQILAMIDPQRTRAGRLLGLPQRNASYEVIEMRWQPVANSHVTRRRVIVTFDSGKRVELSIDSDRRRGGTMSERTTELLTALRSL